MSGRLKLSKVFHINPISISGKSKKDLRNRDTAWKKRGCVGGGFGISWSKTGNLPQLPPNASDEERHERWYALIESISKHGFDDKHPILIHIDQDYIIDGNHRLAIALELKLDYVPVRFQYLGRSE